MLVVVAVRVRRGGLSVDEEKKSWNVKQKWVQGERKAVRLEKEVPMMMLKARNQPIVLQNTSISRQVPRWDPSDIEQLLTNKEFTGAYRNNYSSIFGTYYDPNRPMHVLPYINDSKRYEDSVTLSRDEFIKAFPPNSDLSAPPFHILATSLSDINGALEGQMDLRELISLYPKKSSVNVWISSPGSTTPCHFDGYYNMYLQLSGLKRFILLPPEKHRNVRTFPFLHPSFGQCKEAFGEEGASLPPHLWSERTEIVLRPGELLYIPPHWLHEVQALTTSTSMNVWTDISNSEVLQHLFETKIPGLDSQRLNLKLPIPMTSEEMIQLPVQLDSLTGRFILGYIIAVEVIEGCIGKSKARAVIGDVFSRYDHLIDDGVLLPLPHMLQEPMVAYLSGWKVPLIAKRKSIRFQEVIGDKNLVKSIKAYIEDSVSILRNSDILFQPMTLGYYLEFLSERICSSSRSSAFITLVQKAYENHTK